MSNKPSDEEIAILFRTHTGVEFETTRLEEHLITQEDVLSFSRAVIQASRTPEWVQEIMDELFSALACTTKARRTPEWVEEIMDEVEKIESLAFGYMQFSLDSIRHEAISRKQKLRAMLEGKE